MNAAAGLAFNFGNMSVKDEHDHMAGDVIAAAAFCCDIITWFWRGHQKAPAVHWNKKG